MPNRILKESICRSEEIDSLSWFEEVLFYRLIVICDDFGRYDGRVKIIKGSCFPLKDVTEKDIDKALDKLSAVGLVRVYKAQGRPYLQLVTWAEHQRIRNQKSKYPEYTDDCELLLSIDSKMHQMETSDNKCVRNLIQSESNPNPKSRENARACVCVKCFDEFWSVYPLKKNMVKARGEYEYALKTTTGLTEDMLISAAKNYAEACKINGTTEQYINHPNNWLKDSVWIDYLPDNYKQPKKGRKTRDNNNFQKREYDYDDLESRLLGTGENGKSSLP